MALSVISSDFFLPLSSVKLGRFVKCVEFPTQHYHDPPYAAAPEATSVIGGQYQRTLQGESSTGFASKLTSLMSSTFTKRAKHRVQIETDRVKTFTLDNSEAWFMEATRFNETRSWIENAIGGGGIYFVVGFITVTGARIVHESIKEHQIQGQVTVPVGLSLEAVGVIAPLGNIVDPAMSGNRGVLDGAKTQFVALGEQICALQCRKLSPRLLHSKTIDNLTLSKKPRWTPSESWRRAYIDEAEDEPDILEVDFEASELPEGDWEKEEDEDGNVLLIRSVEESDGF